MRRLGESIAFAGTYLAVVGATALGDVAVATAVGGVLAQLTAVSSPRSSASSSGPLAKRVAATPRLLAAIARAMIAGAVQVFRVAIGRVPWQRGGLVRVAKGERTERGAAVSSLIATAIPGTVLVADEERDGTMVFHDLDARDPKERAEALDDFYRRYQRRVIP